MSRARILADVVAHLEAERFRPAARKPRTTRDEPLDPVTPDQAAQNLARLRDAISDDPTVVDFAERGAA